MKNLVAALVMSLCLACGGDGDGVTGTAGGGGGVANIAGTWNFSDNISSAAVGISCNSAGTVTLNQSGSTFTGTVNATSGTCTDSFGTVVDNTGTQSITGGQINGTNITFQIPFCQLSATLSGTNRISGAETCTIDVAGQPINFTGTFQASR